MRLALFAVALSACSVERKAPDSGGPWMCETDDDCLTGFGCLDLHPYGEAYCAPEYDDSCHGARTATGFCVDACSVGGDDCLPGYECVRGFLPTVAQVPEFNDRLDRGWCLPVNICDSSDDCDSGTICMSEYVPVNPDNPFDSDALVCMPRCDTAADCEDDEFCSADLDDGGGAHVCLPKCDADDLCPPLFSCFDLFRAVMGFGVCLPGTYIFMPCQDDLACMVAECREAGGPGRKFCTYPSCDLPGLFDCPALFPLPFTPEFSLECRDEACVTELNAYLPCAASYPCAGNLECHRFPPAPEICTRHCAGIGPECPDGGHCDGTPPDGWCVPD